MRYCIYKDSVVCRSIRRLSNYRPSSESFSLRCSARKRWAGPGRKGVGLQGFHRPGQPDALEAVSELFLGVRRPPACPPVCPPP